MFLHEGSMSGTTQKTHKTEVMGKILVAGKRLNLGVRGLGGGGTAIYGLYRYVPV